MFVNMKYPLLWKVAALVLTNACCNPAIAAPAKQPAGNAYTVKSGDTFAKIARTHRIALPDLLKANRLSNPDRIQLGQRITIPGAPGSAKPAKTAPDAKLAARPATKKPAPRPGRPNEPTLSPTRRDQVNTTVDLTPPAPAGAYIVQSGDTLSRIQRRTGQSVTSLCKANGITETTILRPGQKLRLSPGTTVARTKPAPLPPRNAAPREVAAPHLQEPEPVLTQPAAPHLPEPPAIPREPAAPAPSTTAPHRIESGETFSSVGRLYGITQGKLTAANPGVNPHKLRIGQTLLIPGQHARPQAQPLIVRGDGRILARQPDPLGTGVPVVTEPVPAERTRTGYLVEEGENLTQIATRFHTSERELRRLNRLGDSDNIYAGRYILVPFIRQAPAGPAYARRDA